MTDKQAERARKEIAEGGYSGKVPTAAIMALQWELSGLQHGTATLSIFIRDGQLVRFATGRERTFVAEVNDGN